MHFQRLSICGRIVYAPKRGKKSVHVRVACNDDLDRPLFITACSYGSIADALIEAKAKPGDSISIDGSLRNGRNDDGAIVYWMEMNRFHIEKVRRRRTKREPVGSVDDGSALA